MNMFARFDENPAMTLRVIKATKRYGRTDARTDGRTDVYIVLEKYQIVPSKAVVGVDRPVYGL